MSHATLVMQYVILAVLCVLAVGLLHILAKSRGWTIPLQDGKIHLLTKSVHETRRVADAAEQSATRAHEALDISVNALTVQLEKLANRLDALLTIRDDVRAMEEAVATTSQEVEMFKAQLLALAYSEREWHERCPLHRAECPLGQSGPENSKKDDDPVK